MSKAAMFFVNDFEETEALVPVDILRRGGVQLDMVSLTGETTVTGSHGVKIETDILFSEITDWSYEMLILPGGPGTESYLEHTCFTEKLSDLCKNGVKIGAICAAPSVLGRLGLLKGIKAVSYPGFEKYLEGAEVLTCSAVTEKNITTSRGAGTAFHFGFELLRVLRGERVMDEIKEKMVYA